MVLVIVHCGPLGAPSKCDLHEDTLRFLLNVRVNSHGFTILESLVIHSHKVEIALIPYVTTPSLRQQAKQFFFLFSFYFSGVKRQEGDDDNNLITPLKTNASTHSRQTDNYDSTH
jgi:hypothetical protein